jgi:hypothetical protein
MGLYVIVYKDKDASQLVLTNEQTKTACIFSEYAKAASIISEVSERLKFLLDGEPKTYSSFLYWAKPYRKTVRDQDKENWERILSTLEIKKISELSFADGTAINKEK